MKPTDIKDLLESQDGGSFKERVERVLSEVANAVIDEGNQGEVNLKIKMDRIQESTQITVASDVSYKRPTNRGKVTENYETKTPMYVNSGGDVSLFSRDQEDAFPEYPTERDQ